MAGLRERQKADRERRILRAAVTRFRTEGYRTVRIEDLAETAEVSVGTVYNYYKTKGEILIATVAMEVEEVLAEGEAIVANPPDGVEAALLALIFQYYDHSLEYLNKEMWRTAMALSIEAPGHAERPTLQCPRQAAGAAGHGADPKIAGARRNRPRSGRGGAWSGGLQYPEHGVHRLRQGRDDDA